jgi:cation transporter-like permease
MNATDFLKTVIILMGLIALLFLGAAFIAFIMGIYDLPFSDWSMGTLVSVFLYLYMFGTLMLLLIAGLIAFVNRQLKKRKNQKIESWMGS